MTNLYTLQALDSDTTIKHPPNETEVAIFAFTSKPDMFSKNTVSIWKAEMNGL